MSDTTVQSTSGRKAPEADAQLSDSQRGRRRWRTVRRGVRARRFPKTSGRVSGARCCPCLNIDLSRYGDRQVSTGSVLALSIFGQVLVV